MTAVEAQPMSERQTAALSLITVPLLWAWVWWRTSPGAVTALFAAGCTVGLLTGRLRKAEARFDAEYRRRRDG